MLKRIVGGTFVAFLVLAIAVTPLSATYRPAYFDLRYVQAPIGSVLNATLEDQTGLVSGVAYAPDATPTNSGSTSTLVVSWIGGCEKPNIYMRFFAVDGGYRLAEQTTGTWCQLLIGNIRTFAMTLRAPIDAAAVEIIHE